MGPHHRPDNKLAEKREIRFILGELKDQVSIITHSMLYIYGIYDIFMLKLFTDLSSFPIRPPPQFVKLIPRPLQVSA